MEKERQVITMVIITENPMINQEYTPEREAQKESTTESKVEDKESLTEKAEVLEEVQAEVVVKSQVVAMKKGN